MAFFAMLLEEKAVPGIRGTAEPQLQLNLLLEVYRATGQSIIAVPPRLVIAVVVVSIASGTVIPIGIVPVTPRLVVLIMVIAVSRSVFLVVTRHTGPATATMALYGKAIRTIIARPCAANRFQQ